jgi:outer membrane protein TolC
MARDRCVFGLVISLAVALFVLLCASSQGWAQTSPPVVPAVGTSQPPFLGSVPTGQASSAPLALSLKDALGRALQYNLGAIEADQDTRAAHAARLRSLNALLPNLSARVLATIEQINLKSNGFNVHVNLPGVSIPTIVGPFSAADARAVVSQEVFNWADIKNLKASREAENAAQHTYKSDRDVVVVTTVDAYLLVISDAATVDSIRAQVETARVLYQRTADQHKAGVVASIDELRSQVELQTQQQRLIAAQNQLSIDKLTLARVIGLPNGQEFELADSVPYAPLTEMSLNDALQQAYATRPDYLSARERQHAAELVLQAASAENYPSLGFSADYGDAGSPNFASSHGVFTLQGSVTIPIFQGTRVRADKLQADSALRQRQAELEDLGGKIDDQVRTAFLNLKSSSDLVAVGKSNIDLANQTLKQAQDRFLSGVADNLEVVQAQESVASAQQSYISSLYSYNLAKVSLAQAIGTAEQSALQYLGAH